MSASRPDLIDYSYKYIILDFAHTLFCAYITFSGAAVTAAVLSPAGPHRSRILSTLIRDERTASLPQHTILSKVFLDHIIRPAEIEAFEKLLAPHQVAKLPPSGNEKAMLAAAEKASASAGAGAEDAAIGEADSEPVCTRSGPSTVLDRAMMEHNVLAASRLYNNITLRGLGALLDLSPAGAETMARRMISQRRLRAEIDQVDGIITFLDDGRLGMHEGGTAGGLGAGTGATADALAAAAGGDQDERAMVDDPDTSYTRRWDAQIARTAGELESICQRLTKEGLLPPAQAVV